MKHNEPDEDAAIRSMAADQVKPDRIETAEQFRELMAHLGQVFWIKNAADDAVLYVSPAYATIGGRTCQSLYDNLQSFLDGVHPEDRERVAKAMAGQRETGGYAEEYRIVRPDGTIRWIWARSYPVRDEQGRIIRFAGIGEDITERKSLEQDRARLAAIVEYSEDAIVSMSVDCIIISWNRGAEQQYGYTAEEIIGCPLSVLFPPDHYQEYQQILKQVRQGEPVASCDTVRRRKDGTLITTSVNIFPIVVRNREVVGVSKIVRDVTALKKLEAQFIEAQKMEVIGQLAAGMAHDFNNLLSVIMGCCGLMLDTLGEDAPVRQDVETIRQATERAAGLTRQLLVLSRSERARPVVLDPNDVVGGLEKMMRHLIDENTELSIVRGEPVGRVKADAGYLGQVLLNLVINARDAMPNGGKLSVTTGNVTLDDAYAGAHPGVKPGPYVRLDVGDTGTGMTAEVQAHVFEPFFTTKPKGKGTGLGLATCDTIVKRCGGHIGVCSEVGRGSTFSLYLPVSDDSPDLSLQPAMSGGGMPRGTETLLLVEGERALRRLVCHVLGSLGYTVLCATSGDGGLRAAREHVGQPVRLVITDVSLPPTGENALGEWVKAACPDCGILVTSEYADDAKAQCDAPAAGMSFLPKPYTMDQLARSVRTMLDQ